MTEHSSLHHGGQKAEKGNACVNWIFPFSFLFFQGSYLLDVSTHIQDMSFLPQLTLSGNILKDNQGGTKPLGGFWSNQVDS